MPSDSSGAEQETVFLRGFDHSPKQIVEVVSRALNSPRALFSNPREKKKKVLFCLSVSGADPGGGALLLHLIF